jgi:uncharacterized protein YraI
VAAQFNEQASYLTLAVGASNNLFAMAEEAIAIRRLFWDEIVPTYPLCHEVVTAAILQGRLLDEWAIRHLANAAGQDVLTATAGDEIARLDAQIKALGSASLEDLIGANVMSIEDRPFMTPSEVTAVLNPQDNEIPPATVPPTTTPQPTAPPPTEPPVTLLPVADQFNVIVNGNVNLRSCGGTQCSTVGTAQNGSLLTVLGTEQASDGLWYQVRLDDGSTAFIAGWLTARGPDRVISTDDATNDPATGCIVAFDIKRGDQDLDVILAGDGMNDVIVDVFKPNQSQPVRVDAQLDKTFIDTGDPYIHQIYGWRENWPTGVYQIEVSRNGASSRLAWALERQGDYSIYVYCL